MIQADLCLVVPIISVDKFIHHIYIHFDMYSLLAIQGIYKVDNLVFLVVFLWF
jgi:hypothetical protein